MTTGTTSTSSDGHPQKSRWGRLWIFCAALAIFLLSYHLFMTYVGTRVRESGLLEQSRTIGLLLFQYGTDNDGKLPEGRTSTEVFQKLIDGGYTPSSGGLSSDIDIFYFPMPGKVRPTSKILKPENVCWDVTCCVSIEDSPHQIPLVYMTGYKVVYKAGTSAVPETSPSSTWWQWLTVSAYPRNFTIVRDLSGWSRLLRAAPDGSIPHFMPTNFSDGGTIYRQLTPDGKLP